MATKTQIDWNDVRKLHLLECVQQKGVHLLKINKLQGFEGILPMFFVDPCMAAYNHPPINANARKLKDMFDKVMKELNTLDPKTNLSAKEEPDIPKLLKQVRTLAMEMYDDDEAKLKSQRIMVAVTSAVINPLEPPTKVPRSSKMIKGVVLGICYMLLK